MDLSKVEDKALIDEYVKRFVITPSKEFVGSVNAMGRHFLAFFEHKDREQFVCTFLNSQHYVITTEVMFTGTINTSAVFPREVIKRALELGATSIAVSHNHPSGKLNVSKNDIDVTKRLKRALKLIEMDLVDHIVVAGNDFLSICTEGYLND